jgi:glutamyl-tRNA synthetase
MHLGNALAALLAWLGARSAGGRILLRIEDLDPRAADPEAARLILEDLAWLGLDWDAGPTFQSERRQLYAGAVSALHDADLTYPCFCTRGELHAASAPHASDGTYVYQGTCRDLSADEVAAKARRRTPACRLAVPAPGDPAGIVHVHDLVFGDLSEDLGRDCGDFLVQRSDGVTAYQLAVTLDDALMGVTQVVRGRDLMGSAARQTWLRATLARLGAVPAGAAAPPEFAHVPLLVAPDGRRLSKREHDLDLGAIRARGVPAPRVVGRLAACVGLAEAREDVMPDELLARFSWEVVRAHRGDVTVREGFLG